MGSTLEELRAAFDGEALLPDDAGYDEARSVWNGGIDRRPTLIARCGTPMQVGEAIALARREGLELTVRGGGHNFAGSAVCDDAVMIDLSPMADVTVDAPARRVRCAGARRGRSSTAPRSSTAWRSRVASSATPASAA